MSDEKAKFSVGQVVIHQIFEYRGVIIDVDGHFLGTEEWYRNVTRSKPPKDRPWYHVLVDGDDLKTYVAERNLEADTTGEPVAHSDIHQHFMSFGDDGRYLMRSKNN